MPTDSDSSIQKLAAEAQVVVDNAIAANARLKAYNDHAVVSDLVRTYFQTLTPTGMQGAALPPVQRHLVDVGAAYGSVAEIFLKDGWSADLFEPDPTCFEKLKGITAPYGAKCRIFPFVVSDEARDSVGFLQNDTPGLSGLAPSPFGITAKELQVRCVRLGTFLEEQKVEKVDFLKVDTEGNDFRVLRGHDFQKLPPTLIFAEFSFYFPDHDAKTLEAGLKQMAEQGYSAIIFEYDDMGNFRNKNWTHKLVAIHIQPDRRPQRKTSFGNIMFFRPDDSHLLQTITKAIHAGR